MNRRTFLKLTGSITILSTTSLTFAKKEEYQWIKATDQLPTIGQRIIQLSKNPMYLGDYTLIIGTYQDSTNIKFYYKQVKFSINQEYRFSNFFGRTRWNYPKTNDEEVRELEWMKTEDVRNAPHSTNCSFDIKYLYWMPVDQLPKKLPPFPKLI